MQCKICEKKVERGEFCGVSCRNEWVSIVKRWKQKAASKTDSAICECPKCHVLYVKQQADQKMCSRCKKKNAKVTLAQERFIYAKAN